MTDGMYTVAIRDLDGRIVTVTGPELGEALADALLTLSADDDEMAESVAEFVLAVNRWSLGDEETDESLDDMAESANVILGNE